jgi:asparagine synthase (glutamine-hydrolysing)
MLFKLRDGAVDPPRAERYWSLRYQPKSSATAEEAEAESIERLDEAVRDRLESEVPLGVLLSGGVDSSAVVAMARRHISGPLRTFSIGFREASHNELPHARAVAERYATEHEEFIVEPRAAEAIERIVWHFDEPFADASALPTFHLCEMTRRRVTVALAGDGGDESFVGYERYRGLPKLRRFERIPRAVRAGLIRPMARLAGRVANGSAFFEKLSLANEISLSDFERRYLAYLTVFHEGMKARLLPGGAMTPDALEWSIRAMRESDAVEPFDRMMACDVATYLPGDLLVKVDRMSMANSLEVRSPFLDDRLMEFAARLPAEIKAPGGELKGLLKRALEPHLPREVLHRPKQGFGVPLDRWFREDLNDMLRDALLGDRARARGLFAMDYVARLIDDHSTGRFRHSHRLWALLVFELWARAHLDRTPSAESPSVEEIAHRTTPSP